MGSSDINLLPRRNLPVWWNAKLGCRVLEIGHVLFIGCLMFELFLCCENLFIVEVAISSMVVHCLLSIYLWV